MAIVSGAHNNDNNRSKASKQSRGVDQPGILLKGDRPGNIAIRNDQDRHEARDGIVHRHGQAGRQTE